MRSFVAAFWVCARLIDSATFSSSRSRKNEKYKRDGDGKMEIELSMGFTDHCLIPVG